MARINFTAGRVHNFTSPADKPQSFLWDSEVPGLGVRATPNGRPAYVVQRKMNGKTLRMTIGDVAAWTIPQAREKAREWLRQCDEGINPLTHRREQHAAREQAEQERAARAEREAITVAQAWSKYIEARTPRWGERNLADHLRLALPGGQVPKRGVKGGKGTLTKPGPLAEFMSLRLVDLTTSHIEAWADREGQTRPTTARLAWRLLKAFLNWCAASEEYADLLPENPARSQKARESLGKPNAKQDALQRDQLGVWFAAVRQLRNPTHAAYLQCLLLLGCRPGELIELRWADVNTRWRSLTIRDKVEGERVIPLPAWVATLLAELPRRGEHVFMTATTEAGQHMDTPDDAHRAACKVAGIEPMVTLHGLRRSFGSLSEWLEIPAGVVAQIQGHKPSAIAEKHYRVRPLDLLRVHHEKFEAWILEQAGIDPATPNGLRVVAENSEKAIP